MESCPRGRRCSTRNFLWSWLFAPLKKPVKSGVFSGSKIEYFVVLSVSSFQKFLEEMRNHIHGELSEWSKVQHSKCCVPKRNLGFESLTLRQMSTVILIELSWTFFMPENRLKSRLFLFQSINEPRCRAFMQRGFLLFPVLTTCDAVVIVKLMGIR